MLVGNDVVDLLDAEARIEGLHPRFVQRVFTAEERLRITASSNPQRILWAQWAAKEAAYKLAKKLQSNTIFAHAAFAVKLHKTQDSSPFRGLVEFAGMHLPLQIDHGREHVHAVVCDSPTGFDSEALLFAVSARPLDENPSNAVREWASEVVGAHLGHAGQLHIDGSRPPKLMLGDQPLGMDLSLSHHGRWLAWAAAGCARGRFFPAVDRPQGRAAIESSPQKTPGGFQNCPSGPP